MTDTIQTPSEEEMTAAIEKLDKTWGSGAGQLVGLIETVRDEETVHTTDGEVCLDDCDGCLTDRIAVAVTRAVNGKAA